MLHWQIPKVTYMLRSCSLCLFTNAFQSIKKLLDELNGGVKKCSVELSKAVFWTENMALIDRLASSSSFDFYLHHFSSFCCQTLDCLAYILDPQNNEMKIVSKILLEFPPNGQILQLWISILYFRYFWVPRVGRGSFVGFFLKRQFYHN